MSSDNQSIGRWISFLHRQFQIYIHQEMKPYDINASEYIYMAELGRDENVNQSALSESLYIDPALTSRVMKSLEKKGYIKRTRSETDKRAIIVSLTDKGRQIQPILIDKLQNWTQNLSKDLNNEEHTFIYDALVQMSNNVKDMRKD